MYYNYLDAPNTSVSMQSVFKGVNKNPRIGEGEFAAMQNMTVDNFPLLSPRSKRTIAQKAPTKTITETITINKEDENGNPVEETVEREVTVSQKLNGFLGDVGFCAIWDNDFYYLGEKIEGVPLSYDKTERKIVAFGAEILVFPDYVYYNTITGEYGSWDEREELTAYPMFKYVSVNGVKAEANRNGYPFLYLPCEYSGYENVSSAAFLFCGFISVNELPKEVSYSRTSNDADRFYRVGDELFYPYKGKTIERDGFGGFYNGDLIVSEWKKATVDEVCIFKANQNFDYTQKNLWVGFENVRYTKRESQNEDDTNKERTTYTAKLTQSIFAYFDDIGTKKYKFDVDVGKEKEYTYSYSATAKFTKRKIPAFDHVCVHDNRLWGCRYGQQIENWDAKNIVNEIYCSELGKYSSFEVGTTANSAYKFSVGEYGDFTGCVSLRGQLLFFKDDIVYRVTGTKPSNFQADKISDSGLQAGCEKTLEVIDGVLYYKSRNGVFAYDGSTPRKISDALGNSFYTEAVAGKHFSKYYITMVSNGKRRMYVYDTRTGLWHEEDNANVRFFTEYDGSLYGAIGNDIVCLAGRPAEIFDTTEEEKVVEWSAETGDIGLDSPYPKYYHRFLIRMDISAGARIAVDVSTDEGDWRNTVDFFTPTKQSFLMPVVVPRCDHMRIRLRGKGDCKIYSICYETETVGGNP